MLSLFGAPICLRTIEGIQKFAFRICAKSLEERYEDLLQLFNLPAMSERRLYLDLCTMFKIVHGFFYFPSGIVSELEPCRITRNTV